MIKSWVKRRIEELIGDDDDVVVNMTLSLLDQDHQLGQPDKRLDPKEIQVYLTGKDPILYILNRFLGRKSSSLCVGALAATLVGLGDPYWNPS